MTVQDVKDIITRALEVVYHRKLGYNQITADELQTKIEQFLLLFKQEMGKDIDYIKKTLEVTKVVEDTANDVMMSHGLGSLLPRIGAFFFAGKNKLIIYQ